MRCSTSRCPHNFSHVVYVSYHLSRYLSIHACMIPQSFDRLLPFCCPSLLTRISLYWLKRIFSVHGVMDLRCLVRAPDSLKESPHRLQWYGRSSGGREGERLMMEIGNEAAYHMHQNLILSPPPSSPLYLCDGGCDESGSLWFGRHSHRARRGNSYSHCGWSYGFSGCLSRKKVDRKGLFDWA
jgi:hypothetical protein